MDWTKAVRRRLLWCARVFSFSVWAWCVWIASASEVDARSYCSFNPGDCSRRWNARKTSVSICSGCKYRTMYRCGLRDAVTWQRLVRRVWQPATDVKAITEPTTEQATNEGVPARGRRGLWTWTWTWTWSRMNEISFRNHSTFSTFTVWLIIAVGEDRTRTCNPRKARDSFTANFITNSEHLSFFIFYTGWVWMKSILAIHPWMKDWMDGCLGWMKFSFHSTITIN